MAMTKAQQRTKVVDAITSREGKNTYTQSSNRDKVDSGYGDCSSTTRWAYQSTLGIDIGVNTEAQIKSTKGKDVNLTITNGIPDESKMLPGDCLYFRGNDASRTKGVGHVEMYVGNGQISGHGSGIGPTRKDMAAYCKQRQNSASTASSLKNKGLICVRRFIEDDATDKNTQTTVDNGAELKVGQTITFTGNKHYTSANAATGKACKPGTAKITQIYKTGKHPYHIVGSNGCTAYGWVDVADICEAATQTGTVICSGLYIRVDAVKTSTSLGIMSKGDTFTVLGTKNGWYKIVWKGITGYCSGGTQYVSVGNVPAGNTTSSGASTSGATNYEKAANFFRENGLTNEYGIFGLLGNIQAESNCNPQNLQDSYESKLGYKDATYTAAVDNGSYTNFVKDAAGYGIAQWTFWSRKQNMLNFHKSKGKSIGDLETQLQFLLKELKESYGSVWKMLQSATSIKQASDVVLTQFERPENQGTSVKNLRAKYGQELYDKYHK